MVKTRERKAESETINLSKTLKRDEPKFIWSHDRRDERIRSTEIRIENYFSVFDEMNRVSASLGFLLLLLLGSVKICSTLSCVDPPEPCKVRSPELLTVLNILEPLCQIAP